LLIGVAATISMSCGDDEAPRPVDGTILVGALTSGTDLDNNGYSISIDGGQGIHLDVIDTTWIDALEAGDYEVAMTDLAQNCSLPLGANPVETTVVPGDTAEVIFNVTCAVIPGGGGPNVRSKVPDSPGR